MAVSVSNGADRVRELADVLASLPAAVGEIFHDPAVTEVMLNPDGAVYFERAGKLALHPGVSIKARALQSAAMAIARPLGYDADDRRPLVDARLPDGSRVAIAGPPVCDSYAITVRRFGSPPLSLRDLIDSGTLDPVACEAAIRAVSEGRNVLVSGGTGSGKTTLMQALLGEVSEDERVTVIEDTRELELDGHPNCLRFEAREAGDEWEEISIRDLVRHVLRHRPDRIVVGEVRGGEAVDLLQALNTGHGGAISTIHAKSAELAPERLATCATLGGVNYPWGVLCQLVGQAIDVVVHVERDRDSGERRVTACRELVGYDQLGGVWVWGEAVGLDALTA